MGGETSTSSSSSPEKSDVSPAPESSTSGDRTAGAPIGVLVVLHKAVRAELDELRRVATEGGAEAWRRKAVVDELRRRLGFLRSVYAYHCAAEDEVIFRALDGRVENIVCTYSIEHRGIDCTFEYIFCCLNGLLEDQEDSCQKYEELVFQISALRESICQHMFKEEEQVFPLLMRQFSHEEQASLVWQYICSVPVMLMEELFPWLAGFLSPDEQLNLEQCVVNIIPQDKLLREVVMSWLDKPTLETRAAGSCVEFDQSSECPDEQDNIKGVCKLHLSKSSSSSSCLWKQELLINVNDSPLNGLLIWHAAIRSELKDIFDKLSQVRSRKCSNLASIIIRINFLTDVLIFYSKALEKFFYPLLEDTCVLQPSSYPLFPHKVEVEEVQQILNGGNQFNMANMEALCSKVEALVLATSKNMSFQETEVFPLISKKYNHKTQQNLLSSSVRMLPLGLLKCVATWFASRLPKDEVKSILHLIEQTNLLSKPFASLLSKWIRTGYSGKTTMEDLHEMFKSRVPYMSQQIREGKDSSKKSKDKIIGSSSGDGSWTSLSNSLSECLQPTEKHGTLYSSGINLLIFSSRASHLVRPFSKHPTEEALINHPEPRPMDHIYYFHKALKKDLESLVLDATKLSENMGLLVEFIKHFHLVRSLYELHSITEDEVAFPALEAKQTVKNLTESYSIDHKLEAECFDRVSKILDEMSELNNTLSSAVVDPVDPGLVKYRQLCFKLQDSCQSLNKILHDHIDREEIELWPLFREYFSTEEQERIIGYMLGRTKAEILQKMIIWLMDSLTSEEQLAMMTFWRKATRYTKFGEWLGEWWEGTNSYGFAKAENLNVSSVPVMDSSDIITKYLSTSPLNHQGSKADDKNLKLSEDDSKATNMIKKMEGLDVDSKKHKSAHLLENEEKQRREEKLNGVVDGHTQLSELSHIVQHRNKLQAMSLEELDAAIMKVAQDSSLDQQEKTRIMQNLRTSHWVAAQPLPDSDNVISTEPGKLPGQFPSYRDEVNSVFGCKHYKQNCKLLAPCCNKLFTCRRCHENEDHVLNRKAITQMMCMKCLIIQPVGATCSTPSCNQFSMAKYYCKICRLFDDEREIYHCPYCNLCRVGKGLGIDYFHCMKCNACMSRFLSVHICREKCFEDKCPICHDDIFTSTIPIKSLACGHMMHSTCFEEYTCMHYTCPVCSKSLGNMQVYFEMLDALLAEEKMPDEFIGQTQAILCNDCEKKGTAPYHWMYHRCPFCGSYNTRPL